MPEPTPPKTILCATDLSSRCDRALDRAALLARHWQAQLVVVHALQTATEFIEARRLHDLPSWRRPEDRAHVVARQLRADMIDPDSRAAVVVEEGEPTEVILREAARWQADLIVTGVARNELFGRRLLGTTVDTLLRGAGAPVLVVRERARRPYERVVVATDFSDGSRHALHAALRLFGAADLTLFHASRAMTGGMVDQVRVRDGWQAVARQDAETFLDAARLPADLRSRLRLLVEQGDPEWLLRDYVEAAGVDLVVAGTRGRGAVLDLLLGSTARRLADGLSCDVLVVPTPRKST
jgi:nucleotide-binding universal stress UspA family protein